MGQGLPPQNHFGRRSTSQEQANATSTAQFKDDALSDLVLHRHRDSSTKRGNVAFYSSLGLVFSCGLMLTFFGGSYFSDLFGNSPLSGSVALSQSTPTYVSSAQSACGMKWMERARNDETLDCYLTHNVKRLCNASERAHLANLIVRYREDRTALEEEENTLMMQSLAADMMGKRIQATNVAMGQFDPIARHVANGFQTTAELGRARDEEERRTRENSVPEGKPGPNVISVDLSHLDAAQRLKVIPDQELAGDIHNLAEIGLLSADDFGWFPDPLVAAALKGVLVKQHLCTSPGQG